MFRRKSAILVSENRSDTRCRHPLQIWLPRKQQLFSTQSGLSQRRMRTALSHCGHTFSVFCNKHPTLPTCGMQTNPSIYLGLILIHPDNWPGLSLRQWGFFSAIFYFYKESLKGLKSHSLNDGWKKTPSQEKSKVWINQTKFSLLIR